ncbi:hypothetical protein QYF36_000251 [Acer negundo]|nr:hypothetical protein QYF36_000251 [Acer negundo]
MIKQSVEVPGTSCGFGAAVGNNTHPLMSITFANNSSSPFCFTLYNSYMCLYLLLLPSIHRLLLSSRRHPRNVASEALELVYEARTTLCSPSSVSLEAGEKCSICLNEYGNQDSVKSSDKV